VVAAARIAGFADIDCGDGGRFNAPPPAEVMAKIEALVGRLARYH
jgi:hypothetical protein